MSEYLVPAKYAKLILLVAKEQGYDVNKLIEEIGLPFNPLALNHDLDLEVTAQSYSKLYQKVSWLLQDEAFGFNGTFRMLCYSIIHCKLLRDSLVRGAEFSNMCRAIIGQQSPQQNPFRLLPDSDDVLLYYTNDHFHSGMPTHASKQLRVINSLALWHRFCSWLIGTDIELTKIHLAGPALPYPDVVEEYFTVPVEYNQPTNALQFAQRYLDAALVHTEESLDEFLKTAPYQLFASQSRDHDNETVSQIRSIIGHNFTRKLPCFDEMASMLNASPRTLRRKLEREGMSYQQIKDECRMDAAKEYLGRPSLSINAVAALMGFDEPSAFHRSFKKWTEMTPGEYRHQMGIHA